MCLDEYVFRLIGIICYLLGIALLLDASACLLLHLVTSSTCREHYRCLTDINQNLSTDSIQNTPQLEQTEDKQTPHILHRSATSPRPYLKHTVTSNENFSGAMNRLVACALPAQHIGG